jgi:hypothetical protein
MNSLFQTKKTNLLIGIYLGGILSHNILTIYWNGIEKLNKYNKNNILFSSDMDAVINGVQKNWFDNLLLSLFWPIRMPLKIMPILILKLNSNDTEIIECDSKEINEDIKNDSKEIKDNIKEKENEIQKDNKIITNAKDPNFDFSDSRHLGFDFSASNVK